MPDGFHLVGAKKPRKKKIGAKTPTIKTSLKTVDYSDIIIPLRIALDFAFQIPVKLGWGKHWELTEDECDELSTNIKDVLEAFPSDTTAQFVIALEKYIPLLTLGMTLYQIVDVRWKQTIAIQKNAKIQSAKESRTTATA